MEIDGVNIFLFTLMGLLILILIGQYSATSYRKLRTGDAGTDHGGTELQVVTESIPSEMTEGEFLTNLMGHN